MTISWKKSLYNPDPILKKLESAKQIDEDGKAKFGSWEFNEYRALLHSLLDFPDDISEVDTRQLVSKAIFQSANKGDITQKRFLEEANRAINEYLSLPNKRYVIVSSISLHLNLSILPKKIIMGDVQIIFERLLPIKFRKGRDIVLKDAEQSLFSSLPNNYLNVRVHVSAKSANHAIEKAIETLDITRGIWNWAINRRYSRRESWGSPKVVNKIVLGPVHTLHFPDGSLVDKYLWWYDPYYLGADEPYSPKQDDFDALGKYFDNIKKKLRKHKYPQDLRNAIIRYARALDERDFTNAFTKLWSILELLTGTTYEDSHKVTINRMAFLYKERDYDFQVLQHLREYRNSYVHSGKENSEIELYLHQIRKYVEDLLSFHLSEQYKFESIQDAAIFLSLPHDETAINNKILDLNKQIKSLNSAKSFFGFE